MSKSFRNFAVENKKQGIMIATSTNNKYYFWIRQQDNISLISTDLTSKEYTSKIECIKAFCEEMEKDRVNNLWGQLRCHHYEDEWQKEETEVIFTLNNND